MKNHLGGTGLSAVNVVSKHCVSLSPDHAVPGVQDLPVGQSGGRGDNLGEKQPGPSGVIGLRVGHQVGDERLCELVLFGPDGEGPAEIPAGDPGQETMSATAAVMCSVSKQWRH